MHSAIECECMYKRVCVCVYECVNVVATSVKERGTRYLILLMRTKSGVPLQGLALVATEMLRGDSLV